MNVTRYPYDSLPFHVVLLSGHAGVTIVVDGHVSSSVCSLRNAHIVDREERRKQGREAGRGQGLRSRGGYATMPGEFPLRR